LQREEDLMLCGTQEELEYHSARAAAELALSHRSQDLIISNAHLELANLHRTRSEVVAALRHSRSNCTLNYICGADKEN
jgi:hypothetical protein